MSKIDKSKCGFYFKRKEDGLGMCNKYYDQCAGFNCYFIEIHKQLHAKDKKFQQAQRIIKKLLERKQCYCTHCDVAERMRKLVYYVTNGMMSYASYSYEAMVQVYDEQLEKLVEKRTKELQELCDNKDQEVEELIVKLVKLTDKALVAIDKIECNTDQLKSENQQYIEGLKKVKKLLYPYISLTSDKYFATALICEAYYTSVKALYGESKDEQKQNVFYRYNNVCKLFYNYQEENPMTNDLSIQLCKLCNVPPMEHAAEFTKPDGSIEKRILRETFPDFENAGNFVKLFNLKIESHEYDGNFLDLIFDNFSNVESHTDFIQTICKHIQDKGTDYKNIKKAIKAVNWNYYND